MGNLFTKAGSQEKPNSSIPVPHTDIHVGERAQPGSGHRWGRKRSPLWCSPASQLSSQDAPTRDLDSLEEYRLPKQGKKHKVDGESLKLHQWKSVNHSPASKTTKSDPMIPATSTCYQKVSSSFIGATDWEQHTKSSKLPHLARKMDTEFHNDSTPHLAKLLHIKNQESATLTKSHRLASLWNPVDIQFSSG